MTPELFPHTAQLLLLSTTAGVGAVDARDCHTWGLPRHPVDPSKKTDYSDLSRGRPLVTQYTEPLTPKGCLTQMREKAHQAFSPDHQSCLRVQEGGLSGRTGP